MVTQTDERQLAPPNISSQSEPLLHLDLERQVQPSAIPAYLASLSNLVRTHRLHSTMRFGSTAKVLLKCKLKYYRISGPTSFWTPAGLCSIMQNKNLSANQPKCLGCELGIFVTDRMARLQIASGTISHSKILLSSKKQ